MSLSSDHSSHLVLAEQHPDSEAAHAEVLGEPPQNMDMRPQPASQQLRHTHERPPSPSLLWPGRLSDAIKDC